MVNMSTIGTSEMCQTSFAVILDQLAEIKTSLHDLRRHVDHRFDSLSQVIPEKLSSAIEQSETRVASRVQKLLGSTRKSSDRLAGERHGEVIDRLAQVNDNFSRWLSNVRLKDGACTHNYQGSESAPKEAVYTQRYTAEGHIADLTSRHGNESPPTPSISLLKPAKGSPNSAEGSSVSQSFSRSRGQGSSQGNSSISIPSPVCGKPQRLGTEAPTVTLPTSPSSGEQSSRDILAPLRRILDKHNDRGSFHSSSHLDQSSVQSTLMTDGPGGSALPTATSKTTYRSSLAWPSEALLLPSANFEEEQLSNLLQLSSSLSSLSDLTDSGTEINKQRASTNPAAPINNKKRKRGRPRKRCNSAKSRSPAQKRLRTLPIAGELTSSTPGVGSAWSWPDATTVNDNGLTVQCVACNNWVHLKCAGLFADDPILESETEDYICPPCNYAQKHDIPVEIYGETANEQCRRCSETVFFVQKILGRLQSWTGTKLKAEYLVLWSGYGLDHATWEPDTEVPAESIQIFTEEALKENLDLKVPNVLLEMARNGEGSWRKTWMDLKEDQLTGPIPPI